MTEPVTIANYPSRPGPYEDDLKAAILKRLRAGRTVIATMNMNRDVVAALATLIRAGLVDVDGDHAVHLRAER